MARRGSPWLVPFELRHFYGSCLLNSVMPRRADVMLASDHAETQQGGVLDGIDQYELPLSTVTRIAKTAVSPRPCKF